MSYVELHAPTPPTRSSTGRRRRRSWRGGGGARLRGAGAHRPRRRLGSDGVRAGVQGARACARSSGPSADGDGDGSAALSPHALVESAGAGGTSAGCSPRLTPGRARSPIASPSPRRSARPRSSGAPRAGLPLRVRARGGLAGLFERRAAPGRRRGAGRRGAGRRLAGAFGPRPLPGRAAAAVLAPRPSAQPVAGGLAERLGVPCVATGERAHARPLASAASGRVGRGAPEVDARGDRARAARQPHRRSGSAGSDGRALPRAPRRGRGERAARGAARLRPHARPRLPLPGLGGPRRRPGAGRALPGPARSPLRGTRRDAEGAAAAGGGAGGDPQARALGVLPAPLRHPRAGPRGGGRGARAGLRRGRCCRRGAGAARASARSSAT